MILFQTFVSFLVLLIEFLLSHSLRNEDTISCCELTTGSCRTTCKQISLTAIASNDELREKEMKSLNYFCSFLLVSFWECINSTLNDIDQNNGWFGRHCCHLAQSQSCQRSCFQSQSIQQLIGCHEIEEPMFNQCLNLTQLSYDCCSMASTQECNQSCHLLFKSYINSRTIKRKHKNKFMKQCKSDAKVIECSKNVFKNEETVDDPQSITHCCNKTSDLGCSQSCRQILQTIKTNQHIVDALVAVCGLPFAIDPSPNDRLWQCFLSLSKSIGTNNKMKELGNQNKNHNINGNNKNKKKSSERRQSTELSIVSSYRFGMDSAKLMCCWKAKSETCRNLCEKTWSDQWLENWHQFDRICQYSPQESNLIQCLDDVEDICQLGCQGLQFCDAFNDRPNQLFRKCDAKSDFAAKEDFDSWMKGVINFNIIEIPVKNVANCNPEVWKTIACSIHIKPCIDHNHHNNICRSTCIEIISECIDSNRIPSSLLSASTICDLISTNNSKQCIDIKTFLNSKSNQIEKVDRKDLLINACNPNPCSSNQLCIINNNCVNDQCLPFRCVPACRLGEMSPFLVKAGAIVKIPDHSHCHHYCRCGMNAQLTDCQLFCRHSQHSDCLVNNKNIPHLTQLTVNSQQCICYNGIMHCIHSECITKCSQQFSPVCANNGQTFPNYCYAQCNGFSHQQYLEGRCDLKDDCQQCNENQRCVKKHQICLLSTDCAQYECISNQIDCQLLGNNNPVCDTYGISHQNLCWLFKKEQKFAYNGKCLLYCSHSGPVCGLNGITYESECVSLSHLVPVDYYSHCNHTSICVGIKCQNQPKCPYPFEQRLPHNCCPICGSIAKVMYNKNYFNLNNNDYNDIKLDYSVTVEELAKSLRDLLQLFGCQLFSYLQIDGYIIVIIKPITISPTEAHLQQCHQELARIVTLINNQSPVISLQFPLSLLIRGEIIDTKPIKSNNFGHSAQNSLILVILSILISCSFKY